MEERRGTEDRLVDDAEDGRAGTDAQRQRENDERCVGPARYEPPDGKRMSCWIDTSPPGPIRSRV